MMILSQHDEADRRRLLQLARESIVHGVSQRVPLPVDVRELPESLQELRATFVTLERAGALRGCIGTLEAIRPLALDVAVNAFGSAFQDPRFPPVKAEELDSLEIYISVLGPATPIPFVDEEDLTARLRPGVDGVILQLGTRRATFLPSVWEMLPQPRQFIAALKHKAHLKPDEDLSELQAWRYSTESFAERVYL